MSEANLVATGPRYLKWIFIGLILFTVFIYFYTINKYAVNIPMKDDYDAILNFINKFSKANLSDKITLLFSQHNEHRILSSRIVFALCYLFTGEVNFRVLGFIANLQLLVISATFLYLIWRLIPRYFMMMSLLTSLCVFDLSNYENSIMAMEGMQNYGVVMLFLIALFFSSKNDKKYLIAAIFTTFLTIFSSGNGIVAAFFILMYNLLIANKKQKIAITLTVAAFVPLYFFKYHNTQYDYSSYDVAAAFNYFISMAGGHFAFGEITNTENANVIGGILIILTLSSFPYGKKMIHDRYLMMLFIITCFILSSMLTISIFRSQLAGNPFYSSRYMIYPNLMVAIFIINTTNKYFINPNIFRLSSAAFTLLCIYSYANNYNYGEKGLNLENKRLTNEQYYCDNPDKAASIAAESCIMNIYCIDNHR